MKRSIMLFLTHAIIIMGACQQPQLVLNEGSIKDDLHQSHIGEITFMNGYVPYDQYTTADMLSSFDLTESSNLNMRVFLDKTLSSHLSKLAPDLSVNQLCSQGNYQFRFYVDGNMIYEENLNTGAGSCNQKNNSTIFSVPLASTESEDSWGRFLWSRFLFRGGGDEALSEQGQYRLKIEARPYINDSGLNVGDVLAEGEIVLNVIKPVASDAEIAVQQIKSGSGWDLSIDKYDSERIESLNRKVVEREFRDIASIAVIKDGKLLIEEYFNNADRSTLHDVRSVGKTFASTVMGIAIKDGHIKNVDERLDQFYELEKFDNYSDEKANVTLKRLLTMSSGFDGNDSDYDSPGNEEYMYPTDDWVKFALDLPMKKDMAVRQQWTYFTAGVVILGDVLNSRVPDGLDKYADRKLFNPLGITDYKWQYTPTNVPNTAGGIRLRTLDFAKYGQLYKNGGTWNGQRILSSDWVNLSLSQQIERPDEKDGYYGYLFWNKQYTVDGKSYEVSFCTGNGGNKIFIFKDIPYVVVITATAYGRPYAHPQVDKMMEEYILPSLLMK